MEDVDTAELLAFAASVVILAVYGYRLVSEKNVCRKIHYSLSCAVAMTHMKKGGGIPLLMLIELGFLFQKRSFVFVAILATHSTSVVEAYPILFFNAFVLFSQAKHEFRRLGSYQIDPIFQALMFVFSEILKFTSLVNAALVAQKTRDIGSFLCCVAANLATTNRSYATSATLVVHSATIHLAFHVKVYWAALMILNAFFSPLYEFSVISEYLIDLAFFARIWYF
jgi:hypothetical protein